VPSDLVPMRWPGEWTDPSALELVRNSPVNCLLVGDNCPLADSMKQLGLEVCRTPPAAVNVVKGEWPGIRVGEGRAGTAGPTGNFWLDSNGWLVRLARMREPGKGVWVETEFPAASKNEKRIFTPNSYLSAFVDAAMHGGRWVIHLDPDLCRSLAAGEARSAAAWKSLMAAAQFFGRHPQWGAGDPIAVVGVLSDFAGSNEFTAGELLNLTARLHQPYRILNKTKPVSLAGLKAILYADAEPPAPDLRRKLIDFVQSGGLVIAGGQSGINEGKPAPEEHRNYTIRMLGRGRIATGDLADPYEVAADAQILLSHRNDLVRFWNCAALGSYYTAGPGGKGGLLQVINYTGRPGADPASVRVAGPYRQARIQRLEDADFESVKANAGKGAIELDLPPIAAYAAIELT
jgi:hypothetical protein